MAYTMPDFSGGGGSDTTDSDDGVNNPVTTITDPFPSEYGSIGEEPESDTDPVTDSDPVDTSDPPADSPDTAPSDPVTDSDGGVPSQAGQSASTAEGARTNRLAAMFSRLGSTGGSEDVAVGSTASSIVADVALNTGIFRENLAGAQEQLEEFRDEHPVAELTDELTGDDGGEQAPPASDDGNASGGGLGLGTVLAAGAVAVGGLMAVSGGDG